MLTRRQHNTKRCCLLFVFVFVLGDIWNELIKYNIDKWNINEAINERSLILSINQDMLRYSNILIIIMINLTTNYRTIWTSSSISNIKKKNKEKRRKWVYKALQFLGEENKENELVNSKNATKFINRYNFWSWHIMCELYD